MSKYKSFSWKDQAAYLEKEAVSYAKEIEQLQKDNKAKQEVIDKLVAGLHDLINSVGGGKKACGHDFPCCCAFDNAKALISSIGEDDE